VVEGATEAVPVIDGIAIDEVVVVGVE